MHKTLTPILLGAGLTLFFATTPAPLRAQENDDCYGCHDDRTLKGTRGGQSISVFVPPRLLAGSVHAKQSCISCHRDLTGTDFPHTENPKAAQCLPCHAVQVQAHTRSLHGQALARGDALAPTCAECHGSHTILPKRNPEAMTSKMKIPFLCGRCHHEGTPVSLTHDIPQDRILENYSDSIHGEGLFKRGLSVSAVCTSCHTSHNILPHTDPESSIARGNVAKTCTQCHSLIEQVHQKVIEGALWEKEPSKIPACPDCHSPHKIRRAFYATGMSTQECMKCHDKKDLTTTRDSKTVSLFVDLAGYDTTSHKTVACAQCHVGASPGHARPCETIGDKKVDCSICHAEVVREYQGGIHGELAAKGDADAPGCVDCHVTHYTKGKKDSSSPTYPRNVPALCARCHREGEKAAKRIHTGVPNIVQSYVESIHGKGLLESGLVVTATCSDCHTPHKPLPPSDPRSSVNSANVANTCGKCHNGIEDIFKTSVHWPGNIKTDKKLPTCESCHTSHTISRTDQADFRMRMMVQCGRCHTSEAETFFETYHGKVSKLGSAGAAKCYDCHGTHNIMEPSDPRSTLARDHVIKTCGQCHEGANRRFAGYLTHATHHDREKYPALYYAFWGMTALLVGTLTFALLHTFAWLVRLWRTRETWRRHKHAPAGKIYRRFTTFQSRMHLVMLLSFFTLALTGMTLKFSYMSWALMLSHVLGGFAAMGFLHRLGAIILMGVFLTHLWDLNRGRKLEGKSWLSYAFGSTSIMLNLTDLRELIGSFKWFFGRGPRPRYGRYSYWEKFDWFAVFWGVFVIGSSGLILWFPEFMTHVLPGWTINVATIIHSDEALLAVAFIFTVHFFNTHFRPDKFPMDPVIFTGRVGLEEMKFDKPREYDEMVASGRLEGRLVEPFPQQWERPIRIFGFTALGIGLTLVALIFYSMVFGYE